MPNDKFVMSARQAAELDHAFERTGWTPEDVKRLSSGDKLREVLSFVCGNANLNYSCIRETGEFHEITLPPLQRVSYQDICSKYRWAKAVHDISPEKEVLLKIVTILHEREEVITPRDGRQRLGSIMGYLLGYQHLLWLMQAQDTIPRSVREKLSIYFPGTRLEDVNGMLSIPCLFPIGGQWHFQWESVEWAFKRRDRIASWK